MNDKFVIGYNNCPPPGLGNIEIDLGSDEFINIRPQANCTLGLCNTAGPCHACTDANTNVHVALYSDSYRGMVTDPTRTGTTTCVVELLSEDHTTHYYLLWEQRPIPLLLRAMLRIANKREFVMSPRCRHTVKSVDSAQYAMSTRSYNHLLKCSSVGVCPWPCHSYDKDHESHSQTRWAQMLCSMKSTYSELTKRLGIEQKISTSNCLQIHGQAERYVQVLNRLLYAYIAQSNYTRTVEYTIAANRAFCITQRTTPLCITHCLILTWGTYLMNWS